MTKSADQVTQAFLRGDSKSVGNYSTDGQTLSLFGNIIAWKVGNGIEITTAGWETVTTKRALNCLPGVSVYTNKGQLFLNGKEWDGCNTVIQLNHK